MDLGILCGFTLATTHAMCTPFHKIPGQALVCKACEWGRGLTAELAAGVSRNENRDVPVRAELRALGIPFLQVSYAYCGIYAHATAKSPPVQTVQCK